MKKILTLLFAITLFLASAEAVPAYPYPIKFTQPDGTVITALIKGDEKVHWRETTDGYTLMFNKDGYLTYAMKDSRGELQPSDIIATEIKDRDAKANSLLSNVGKRAFYSEEQLSVLLQVWQAYEITKSRMEKAGVVIGDYNTVCALVQFPEKNMTYTKADFDGLMNEIGYNTGGVTGSLKDYFLESSYNQFNLSVILAGPYTAPESEAYYAGHNGSQHCNDLAQWLAEQADKDIDYAECDHDGDGVVDNFHFIFAGYGQETDIKDKAVIWSHSWAFDPITLDGKQLSTYSCSPELKSHSGDTLTTVGVIAHEISHAFGAFDYYDTNYGQGGQYEGTGQWDLMASGNWNNSGITPAHHNMYQKIQYGWVKPEALSKAATIGNMPTSTLNPVAYIVNTTTPDEYFLIENKQNMRFDGYIPGHGLLIYRVHKDLKNNTHNSINAIHQQRLYPVCASAETAIPTGYIKTYGIINGTGCPFPGSTSKPSFTDETIPSMKSWAGENTNKPITNIVETDEFISFDFMGGGSKVEWVPVSIIAFDNGTIVVKSDDRTLMPESYIKNGTTLTITAIPDKGYEVKEVKVNGEIITGNASTVDGETTIIAKFQLKPNAVNSINNDNIKIVANDNTITIYNANSTPTNVVVVDMSGKVVENLTMIGSQSTIIIPIKGLYIVQVNSGNSIKIDKVIIQ